MKVAGRWGISSMRISGGEVGRKITVGELEAEKGGEHQEVRWSRAVIHIVQLSFIFRWMTQDL